ncbi:UNC-like C-terminal-domain-containing protein, partial [Phascolomyces articulosus]
VADFALATRGARVIPKMTSTTYTPSKKHPWKAAVARALGIHPGTYRASPLIALLPDTHVGQCWPMDGSNGTLSIVLSQPIDIKSITMEYPTKDQMVNMTSAPKDFEIWGLRKVQVPFFTSIQWPWHQHNTNDTNAKHLGTFRYDIQTGRSIQTFNVVNSHEKKEKEVNQDEEEGHSGLFEAVIVRVISNWGLEAYTCLYRVRVHGE